MNWQTSWLYQSRSSTLISCSARRMRQTHVPRTLRVTPGCNGIRLAGGKGWNPITTMLNGPKPLAAIGLYHPDTSGCVGMLLGFVYYMCMIVLHILHYSIIYTIHIFVMFCIMSILHVDI